jgi:MFS family permease
MFLKIAPLREREFRLLYVGQTISFLGSMLTYVAIPYQVYELSRSAWYVGLLSGAQLAPLVFAAVFGGAMADTLDRRRMLVLSELALTVCSAALLVNAMLPHPSLWALFAVAIAMSAINGFHRPALEAMTQELVAHDQQAAAAALGSLRFSLGAIAGPACAGVVIAKLGQPAAYAIDAISFAGSVACLSAMLPLPRKPATGASTLGNIAEGVRYARGRQELIGTYVVDIVAMIFAMPVALFPMLAERWSGATAAGWLYSAMAIGSLVVTLFSGWSSGVRRQGAAVVAAAALWGLAIIALGFAPTLASAVACLAVAGAADMVSGLFRQTIWNQTIPSELRGRLSGLEMLSYMTGPLLGNARAGYLATRFDARLSIVSGGVLCVLGVLLCVPFLPRFFAYRSPPPPSLPIE